MLMLRLPRAVWLGIVVALFWSASFAMVGWAATAERDVAGGCRVGAEAFEHWTRARHVAYDDNDRCDLIRLDSRRRCWNRTYRYKSGYVSDERIDVEWGWCDALYSRTDAKTSGGTYLGYVDVWQ